MIKKIMIMMFLTLLTINQANAGNFVEGLEDIPLMRGLVQQPNHISFGNEQSRLVEVHLKAKKVSLKQVEKFYTNTLPQMGWTFQGKRKDTLIFYREGEVIDIAPEQTKPLIIRITVKNRI